MSLNFLATRFRCTWPWDILVMLCDGRIVCGCADPYGKRVLGDARTSTVNQIWTGRFMHALRDDMNTGGSDFCGDCALKLPLKEGEEPRVRSLDAGPLPGRMFIECTAACNISCSQACCAPETGITKTRQTGMLDFDLFKKVIDEVGPTLGRVDFFNYGEAFLHKRAVEMCEYIKTNFPHIYLYTSTNGGALSEEQARRLVHSGIDEVTFSIDGARPESYIQYRQRGKFDVTMRNLRAMADEKRKSGRDLPFLNWRYILFKWNDSDEEMAEARRMAADIGVDRLCWEITDHPEDSFSRRFVHGSPEFEAIRKETWDDSNLGNAIEGATPRARIDVKPPLPIPGLSGRPLKARAGQPLRVRTRVHNLSTRTFPADATYGRRLVRLGAQLCDENGELLDLNFARARLPGPLAPGKAADIDIELPQLPAAGRYTLKFDLVSEGVDWFENCGSPTTLKPLVVR
ncbi:MAG: radical SAM protein [Acidobacteriota bacterium]|nr:radical SAM protein [Acidobacteriota bacterium]